MHDEDATTRDALAVELAAAFEETARLRRELDAVEADLARVVERFLEAADRSEPALDPSRGIGPQRRTLH